MKRRCVSYVGRDVRGSFVTGNIDLHMDEPIASIEDIKEIQDCIKHQFNYREVAILNIINYENDCQ